MCAKYSGLKRVKPIKTKGEYKLQAIKILRDFQELETEENGDIEIQAEYENRKDMMSLYDSLSYVCRIENLPVKVITKKGKIRLRKITSS